MIKTLVVASSTVLLLAFTRPAAAQNSATKAKPDVKFLDDIEVSVESIVNEPEKKETGSKFAIFKNLFSKKHNEPKTAIDGDTKISVNTNNNTSSVNSVPVEKATSLQLKYSVLLNTEVEEIRNIALFRAIDEWYGTPYVYGGTTKNGIDCSAFVQTIFTGLFGVTLPRTAHEQYKATRPISRTELQQGDLVFFNTRGGVSHVGIYLQNNQFVHAAVSEGVMISDLFDDYWMRRFIGAGRYGNIDVASLFSY